MQYLLMICGVESDTVEPEENPDNLELDPEAASSYCQHSSSPAPTRTADISPAASQSRSTTRDTGLPAESALSFA